MDSALQTWVEAMRQPCSRLEKNQSHALTRHNLEQHITDLVMHSVIFRDVIDISNPSPSFNKKTTNLDTITSQSFRDWKKDCCKSRNAACLKWHEVKAFDEQNSLLREYALSLANAVDMQLQKQMKYLSTDEKNTIFACKACNCTLYRFEPNLLKQKQHLQTLQIIWAKSDLCHSTMNSINRVEMILCRACELLWKLCGCNHFTFDAAIQLYFRGYGKVYASSSSSSSSSMSPRGEQSDNTSNDILSPSSSSIGVNNHQKSHSHKQEPFYPFYEENIMDSERIHLINSHPEEISRGCIKSAWLLQLGLVCYPVNPFPSVDDIKSSEQEIEDTYHWIKGRALMRRRLPLSKGCTTDNDQTKSTNSLLYNQHPQLVQSEEEILAESESKLNINNKDEHSNDSDISKKIPFITSTDFVYLSEDRKNRIACSLKQLNEIPLHIRSSWPRYYCNRSNEYLTFWIPLDCSGRSFQFNAATIIPRNPNKPLSEHNFLISTKFLALAEQKFGRQSVIEWLCKVSYISNNRFNALQQSNCRLVDFVKHRFKRQKKQDSLSNNDNQSPSVVLPQIDIKAQAEIPSFMIELGSQCRMTKQNMQDLYDSLRQNEIIVQKCEILQTQLDLIKKEVECFEKEYKSMQIDIQNFEDEIRANIPLFQRSVYGQDLLEHLGIKSIGSKKDVVRASKKFTELNSADQVHILKQWFLQRHPNKAQLSDTEHAQLDADLIRFVHCLDNPDNLNSVRDLELNHRMYVYNAEERQRRKQEKHNQILQKAQQNELDNIAQIINLDESDKNDALSVCSKELNFLQKRFGKLEIGPINEYRI